MSPLPGVYVPSTWCLCPLSLVSMSLLPGVYVPSTWCLCPLYLVSMSPLTGVYVPSTWCLCPFYLVSMSPLPGVYAREVKDPTHGVNVFPVVDPPTTEKDSFNKHCCRRCDYSSRKMTMANQNGGHCDSRIRCPAKRT